jgi:hypothetical protein
VRRQHHVIAQGEIQLDLAGGGHRIDQQQAPASRTNFDTSGNGCTTPVSLLAAITATRARPLPSRRATRRPSSRARPFPSPRRCTRTQGKRSASDRRSPAPRHARSPKQISR